MVDEDGARLHAVEGAVGAGRHRAQVLVVADAAEHHVLPLGRFGRRRGGAPAMRGDPLLRPRRGAVVDGDLMAGLGEVPGHGKAHDAEAEKGNVCHGCS